MKKYALIAAITFAATGYAFAGTEFSIKDGGTNAQGNTVGVYSSDGTGNGANIGGNGGTVDQTTAPGSRAAEVQAIQASQGKGSINSATNNGNNAGKGNGANSR